MEETARAAVLRLRPLARLARAHVLGDIRVLTDPEARRRTSDPARPKCPPRGPSWHSRSTCARSPLPAGMQRRSASPCPRRYRRPQRTRKVPSLGVWAVATMGAPYRSTSWPSAAAAPRMMGPKNVSTLSAAAKVWTKVGARKKTSEGVGGCGAVVVPVPSGSSEPASAVNILEPWGDSPAPPRAAVEGVPPPPWALANVAAAVRRVTAHRARTAASTACSGASRPRREKSSC
jgi:hypothetical protein